MKDRSQMEGALDVLKTLNHPVRLSILCNLIEKNEMSAGEIVEQEKDLASQSQVSQYLRWLKDKNFITSRKEGQLVYYKITSSEIQTLIKVMHDLFCKN